MKRTILTVITAIVALCSSLTAAHAQFQPGKTYTCTVIESDEELSAKGGDIRSYMVKVANSGAGYAYTRVAALDANGNVIFKMTVAANVNSFPGPSGIKAGKLYYGKMVTITAYTNVIGRSFVPLDGTPDYGPAVMGVMN